jgi:hypothetical protein
MAEVPCSLPPATAMHLSSTAFLSMAEALLRPWRKQQSTWPLMTMDLSMSLISSCHGRRRSWMAPTKISAQLHSSSYQANFSVAASLAWVSSLARAVRRTFSTLMILAGTATAQTSKTESSKSPRTRIQSILELASIHSKVATSISTSSNTQLISPSSTATAVWPHSTKSLILQKRMPTFLELVMGQPHHLTISLAPASCGHQTSKVPICASTMLFQTMASLLSSTPSSRLVLPSSHDRSSEMALSIRARL